MNAQKVLAIYIFIGICFGLLIGLLENYRLWFLEILFGGFLFWQIGRAFLVKYYYIIIGPIVGLLISIGSDLAAGSEITLRFKLMYMTMGLFAAGFPKKYWKILLGGIAIGGLIGFYWGLQQCRMFGNVCVPPGLLNALLMAVQVSMIATTFSRLLAETIGQNFYRAGKSTSTPGKDIGKT